MTRRVRHLMVAGAVDSIGLAFGWTVFNLLAVLRHGLAATALLNAAMFCGIALSAPAAARLTRRLNGRQVLQVTAGLEALLRVWSLALLYWGAPLPVLVVMVLAMNVVGWIGFAGMRVEIAAADPDAAGMTRYLAVTVALEAVGASLAALLPITGHGGISASWVAVALVAYGLSLLPTTVVAGASTVAVSAVRTSVAGVTAAAADHRRLLAAGAVLMVVGSGPTLLFVGLATELHGHSAVAGAAVAFAVGSLLSPAAARLLFRSGTSVLGTWPFWCAGMVIGWMAAPWSVAGLLFAQLISGLCLTGFQGAMDHALAGDAEDGRATTSLAQGSAARAVGSAAAVRLVPLFSAPVPLAAFAGVTALLGLVGGAVLARTLEPQPDASGDPLPTTTPVSATVG